jgi:hypothetical protein
MSNEYEMVLAGTPSIAQLLNPESKNGANKPSLSKIRSMIIDYNSSRNFIISNDDLIKYLQSFGVKYVKQRDDFYKREFLTYTLLEDTTYNYIIPTRTGELLFKESELENQYAVDAWLVPPNNVYQFWLADDTIFYNYDRFIAASHLDSEDGLSPTLALQNENWTYLYDKFVKYNGVLMMCPFIIKVFKDPYFAALYDVYCNDDIGLSFGYNNYNSSEKFSITAISIRREDMRCPTYTISVEVATSDTIFEEFATLQYSNEFSVRVKIEILDSNNQTYGYINLPHINVNEANTKLVFWAELQTDNVFHREGMVRITNGAITPTNDVTYTKNDIVPELYFLPFSAKLRAYVAYSPPVAFTNEYNPYMLTAIEKELGYIITDMFETDTACSFVRELSDVFSITLEVILSPGIWPAYTEDVPAQWEQIVFEKDLNGALVLDDTGVPIIEHNIGDPVLDSATLLPIYLHRLGDPVLHYDANNNPIYAKEPEITYIIKRVPLISMLHMLSPQHKYLVYTNLQNIIKKIQYEVLSRLVENNSVSITLYNTFGPAKTFLQGSGLVFTPLKNLDISLALNIHLTNNDLIEVIRDPMVDTISDYIRDVMKLGYFYIDELLTLLRYAYEDILYIEFCNINNATTDIQTIKQNPSAVSDDTITPEYISINTLLDVDAFKKDGTVLLSPNITINFIAG